MKLISNTSGRLFAHGNLFVMLGSKNDILDREAHGGSIELGYFCFEHLLHFYFKLSVRNDAQWIGGVYCFNQASNES